MSNAQNVAFEKARTCPKDRLPAWAELGVTSRRAVADEISREWGIPLHGFLNTVPEHSSTI
jgi:hypothetical protein